MKNNEKLWLIGFIEAEGCLHISTKNQFIFTITQGYRNIHILYSRNTRNWESNKTRFKNI